MSENSRPTSETTVMIHDVRLSIAEILGRPLTLSDFPISTLRQNIRKYLDLLTGSAKPFTMQVRANCQPSSIEKIMRRHL